MTPVDVPAIQTRLFSATPGPWHENDDYDAGCFPDHVYSGMPGRNSHTVVQEVNESMPNFRSNVTFIAHAPDDVATLLQALAERDALLNSIQNVIVNINRDVTTPSEACWQIVALMGDA